MSRKLHTRTHVKPDGRNLWLYGWQEHELPVTEELEPLPPPNPHMRWHPLRQEWVAYATYRQDRTFKPPAGFCPLCPVDKGGYPGEIPFTGFEVAVFENRFPGFHLEAHGAPELVVPSAPATGRCEVMVFSSDHSGSFATLPQERRELILRVWAERFRALLGDDRIQAVMPFENRGEEVGVTLHHPHGQIYAFSFLPPVIEKMAKGFREGSQIETLLDKTRGAYEVWGDDNVTAFVPPFQRYPYEVWLAPRKRVAGPWLMEDDGLSSMASGIGEIVRRYDALFGKTFPYIMVVYAAPKGEEGHFHFHIQFLPFLRTETKLKYLAGCETGAGTFLVDVAPEWTVERLREVAL
ncbi:galactose-1-phosphate uridylyltransferase [Radicibacter daui]|uniref:galactose-1-phosphate uridylyltransferase n=1 Tax=Radicibacter daui TaxID=3064829 RepID=UPI004046DFE9